MKKKEKKKNKKKEKKGKRKVGSTRNLTQDPLRARPFSLPLRQVGQYYERGDNILFKTFPSRTFHWRALLNTNSKIFFRRMTGVLTVKNST